MICEKGLGFSNDCLPATQSSISWLSAENLKIGRSLAHFLTDEGPERPDSALRN
jgi:hypothetical protein